MRRSAVRTLVLASAVLAAAGRNPAHAQSYLWGGSAGALWSDPANWGARVVPVAGDAVQLNFSGRLSNAATNDLAPTPFALQAIRFINSPAYTISGNALRFVNSPFIECAAVQHQSILNDLVLADTLGAGPERHA